MSKRKAAVVTTIVSVMLAAFLWLTCDRAIHVYEVLKTIFAAYGIIRFVMDFYHWLIKPAKKTERLPAWGMGEM